MTVAITIDISDALSKQLQSVQDRLPEVLERGLREVLADVTDSPIQDERAIIDVLTSQPTPEQVMALQPSPELQARVGALLARSKKGARSGQEETEPDRYLYLEHLVCMAKAKAFRQLTPGT
jgi:hypothetical protein